MSKLRIRVKRPWIAYPGSTIQQNYAEDIEHGYLLWNIDDRKGHNVTFQRLPNPRPFVTIEWAGSVDETFTNARQLVVGARYRVKSREHVSQSDMDRLTNELKSRFKALEVTYKAEQQINSQLIAAGDMNVVKDDLRNPDVLLRLIKSHYRDIKLDDAAWNSISELVKSLLKLASGDDITRNTEWSLRHLKYDNLFVFGDGNELDFDAVSGITGIFGPNRVGKSSIVGSIMYALFNTTDRGSIANVHVVNARKPYGFSRALINVNGVDYVIERQTVKHENKRSEINATTQLNLFRIEHSGDVTDLNGVQRSDTEQAIRKLIGTCDDFMLTSAAAQGDVNRFISEGASQRKKVLARYLDLDIFDRMHKLVNDEVNALRALLKEVPEQNWSELLANEHTAIDACYARSNELACRLESMHSEFDALKVRASKHSDVTLVTNMQVSALAAHVDRLRNAERSLRAEHDEIEESLAEIKEKLKKIDDVIGQVDLAHLRHQLDVHRELEAAVVALKHQHEREQSLLRQQERTLRILDEVPCGDSFQTCKFIKDAHSAKNVVSRQRAAVEEALLQLQRAQEALAKQQIGELKEKISKCEKLAELASRLRSDEGAKLAAHARIEARLARQTVELSVEEARLDSLREALKNEENEELVHIRRQLDDLQSKIKNLDSERLIVATEQGRRQSNVEKLHREQQRFVELQAKLKIHDLVANALSRRGVPNMIVSLQLPLINAEIARILHGIVDFTVELQGDVESNAMDIFINYGDSRRIIELASGMEKTLSSIAIRVALRSVSSLPKTNMLIIDEGFGTLDDASVEACNRLLVSLKRTFKNVVVITHVDGIKDVADNMVEIVRVENDSRVMHK